MSSDVKVQSSENIFYTYIIIIIIILVFFFFFAFNIFIMEKVH